jgi:hypothetical protein
MPAAEWAPGLFRPPKPKTHCTAPIGAIDQKLVKC